MFGRRDRCLLVLSQLAGVPYRHLATLTAGDVTSPAAPPRSQPRRRMDWSPAATVLCGPCAVVRWLRILNLVATRPSNRDLAQALKKAKPVTSGSPHLCRSTRGSDDATLAVPLLPPIDQWGYLPFPVQRLTPHSLSRRVRDLLDGDLGAHRDLPVDTDDGPEHRRRRHRRSRGRCTAGKTRNGPGPAAAPTSPTSPGSRTSSTRSTPAPRNCNNEPRPSWPRKPATNHHPAKGLLTSDVACRHPGHRRPEPGPCAMPLHLAVPMDHPGHGITSTQQIAERVATPHVQETARPSPLR